MGNQEQIIIKKYTGSQANATALYQADSIKMAAQNYFPTSQSWVPGRWSGSDFFVALLLCFFIIGFFIFLYMLVVTPKGTLAVTYELRGYEEKTCPKCAEQVKVAALICRFCGHEFTPSPQTYPTGEQESSSVKNEKKIQSSKKSSKVFLAILALFIMFCGISAFQDRGHPLQPINAKVPSNASGSLPKTLSGAKDGQKEQQTASLLPTATTIEPVNKPPVETWEYTTQIDAMTQKEIWGAAVTSSNTIVLDFPYSGPQNAALLLRQHPQHGKNVIFQIERGQLLCDSDDDCSLLVRFDNEPAEKFTASTSADRSTTVLFIRNYERFVQKLAKASKVFIQVAIYQNGNQTLEFNVSGLKLNKTAAQ